MDFMTYMDGSAVRTAFQSDQSSDTTGIKAYEARSRGYARFPDIRTGTDLAAKKIFGKCSGKGLALTGVITLGSEEVIDSRWDPAQPEPKAGDLKEQPVAGMPLEDGPASFEWKKRLISNAKERIVLSGNYCGGRAFDEVLELMSTQLTSEPALKVVILSSPKFLTLSNKAKLEAIQLLHPGRVEIVFTGDHFLETGEEFKKITNHTKGLVVDGRHFILGGSGLEDKYAYYHGVGDRGGQPSQNAGASEANAGFLAAFLPRGFRDMDFLFTGTDLGREVERELLQLARIWQGYNDPQFATETPPDSVVGDLLSTPPNPEGAVPVSEMGGATDMAAGTGYILSTGPEMDSSAFHRELMRHFNGANERIAIDHMYIHPTEEMIDLLIEKVNSGVELTIVTNGYEEFSPKSHMMFGGRNRWVYATIAARIDEDKKHLLHVYEFGQEHSGTPQKTTLHKKVIVIDDKVIAGSSNLGYKSTVTSSDHEINFVVTSRKMADATVGVIAQDAFGIRRQAFKDQEEKVAVKDEGGKKLELPLSRPVAHPEEKRTASNWIQSARHGVGAWIWG